MSEPANLYATFAARCADARRALSRPLTFAEKVLVNHLPKLPAPLPKRRESEVALFPDRVAMQDATAQMAVLQFMHAGRDQAAVPTTIHCDHLIRAHQGAAADLTTARTENAEVYDFLKSAAARYAMGFWEPGAGIIHQVVLENYAFPGGMMIGTDSHTPNAGGLGMIAIGVGGADAVDVMVGEPFGLRWPGLIGVRLTGTPSGWTSPKDVILKLMSVLTTKGGTGHIVEFFGAGTRALSCTGKATICNMGAEHGATTSLFPFDERMAAYLRQTGRQDVAELAEAHAQELCADAQVEADPAHFFDRVVEIDLSTLEPHLVGPHTPDLARPISAMAQDVRAQGYPNNVRFALIGSCTNSSYEDIDRSAHLARQARAAGLTLKIPLMVTPGSEQIHHTIARDGQLEVLTSVGATVLANACGPCIGQWKRDDLKNDEKNSILTSYNRNFKGRNDGNRETLAFIGSPELVTAMAFAGTLDFNPLRDTLKTSTGGTFRFEPPEGAELPARGFAAGLSGFVAPTTESRSVAVQISPRSERLQALERFAPWDGKNFDKLVILLKAKGKCTTDHISAAGPWLRFRGHLDHISDNLFLGAVNAFTDQTGTATNVLTGETGVSFPKLARAYKAQGQGWVAIGDENYGEGSSREHAAMSPRFLGAKAVITKSFARIHETNLKKQGVLPLTFVDPKDYDQLQERDLLNIQGLSSLAPGVELQVQVAHADGSKVTVPVRHTLTQEQIEWFQAGSALNRIAAAQKS